MPWCIAVRSLLLQVRNWKRRYFILKKGFVYYQKGEKGGWTTQELEANMRGRIPLAYGLNRLLMPFRSF